MCGDSATYSEVCCKADSFSYSVYMVFKHFLILLCITGRREKIKASESVNPLKPTDNKINVQKNKFYWQAFSLSRLSILNFKGEGRKWFSIHYHKEEDLKC